MRLGGGDRVARRRRGVVDAGRASKARDDGDSIIPFSEPLEQAVLPGVEEVISAVRSLT